MEACFVYRFFFFFADNAGVGTSEAESVGDSQARCSRLTVNRPAAARLESESLPGRFLSPGPAGPRLAPSQPPPSRLLSSPLPSEGISSTMTTSDAHSVSHLRRQSKVGSLRFALTYQGHEQFVKVSWYKQHNVLIPVGGKPASRYQ